MSDDRKTVLLKACLDFFQKMDQSATVFGETVHYDGADCDAYCLMEDIAMALRERS